VELAHLHGLNCNDDVALRADPPGTTFLSRASLQRPLQHFYNTPPPYLDILNTLEQSLKLQPKSIDTSRTFIMDVCAFVCPRDEDAW
jgi:hypothetical protein